MLTPLHLGRKIKSTFFLILIISALFLNTTAQAQESTLAYERLDILINLESGGDYTVTETQLISFDDEYRFGFLEIPLEFTESIEVLTVNDALGPYQRNGTGPGSYTVEQEGDALYVDWEMPATSAGETRLFTISYRVTGGLFVFPTYQQLDWELFPADRGGLPIKASTIMVIFPDNIDQETVQPTLAGMDAAETFSNRSLIYISNAPILDGTAARLVIAYDAALAPDVVIPSWQPSNLQPDPTIQFGAGEAVVDNLSILIDVQPDGDLIVTERQTVTFTGRFEYGFLEIPSQFADYIDILSVADEISSYVKADGGAATYQTEEKRGVTKVTWQFEPTQGITTREFVVTYRIFEGIFVYPQENQLDFSFIGLDDASPPKNATLQVKFPQPLTAYNMQAASAGVALQHSLLNGILQFDLIEEATPHLGSDIFIQFDPALTPDATPPDWQIALDERQLEFEIMAVNVDLEIQPDGNLLVEETQLIRVEDGALYGGERVYRRNHLDALDNIQFFKNSESIAPCQNCLNVTVQDRSPTWVVANENGGLFYDPNKYGRYTIDWSIPPILSGEERSITFSFEVISPLKRFTDRQRLSWTVIPSRFPDVSNSQVTLRLPAGTLPSDVTVIKGRVTAVDGQTMVIARPPNIAPHVEWTLNVDLPYGATAAETSNWQKDIAAVVRDIKAREREAAEAEALRIQKVEQRQRANILIGLSILAIGALGILFLWYQRGRDPDLRATIPDIISEPPSDLPPAIVDYLLNEKPTSKGIMAMLFSMAHLGLIQIKTRPGQNRLRFRRNWPRKLEKAEKIINEIGKEVAVPPHIVTLFNHLYPSLPNDSQVTLSFVSTRIKPILPVIYLQMAEQADQYFEERPSIVRSEWTGKAQLGMLLGFVGMLIAYSRVIPDEAADTLSNYFPTAAFLIVSIVLWIVSRHMPQRNSRGVEESARWLAFKAYLFDLNHYRDLKAAQNILDNYFHYAIALGTESFALQRSPQRNSLTLPRWSQPIEWQPISGSGDAQPSSESSEAVTTRTRLRPVLRENRPVSPNDASARLEPKPIYTLNQLSQSISVGLDSSNHQITRMLNETAASLGNGGISAFINRIGGGETVQWSANSSSETVLDDLLRSMSSGARSSSSNYHGSLTRSDSARSNATYRSRSSSTTWTPSSSSSRSSGFGSSSSSSSSSRSSSSSSSSRSSGGGRGFRK